MTCVRTRSKNEGGRNSSSLAKYSGYTIAFNPERPIYFYPLAADCHSKCYMIYFGNFGRLKVVRGQNDHSWPNAEFNSVFLSVTIFFLNDRKVVKNKICFLKFLIFFKIKKNINIKTIITFYRKQLLENKNFMAVILV